MVRRAVRLENIVFKNPLFIQEEFSPENTKTNTYMSCAGTHIVFEHRIYTPYITLESRDSGWLSEKNYKDILSIWDDLGGEYELELSDGSIIIVRAAREKELNIQDLFEGAAYYVATIPLAKVM